MARYDIWVFPQLYIFVICNAKRKRLLIIHLFQNISVSIKLNYFDREIFK